jgi:hypothetical protein
MSGRRDEALFLHSGQVLNRRSSDAIKESEK